MADIAVVNDRNWKALIRPNRPVIEAGRDPNRVAKLVVEPLERGFGTTLGNALRRILLSSLQGAAIIGVQIDGVVHEFSSIPGVREDVTTIVLNLKQVAIDMQSDTPKRMVLKASGSGPVKAGQIETSGDIQILNPDLIERVADIDDLAPRLIGVIQNRQQRVNDVLNMDEGPARLAPIHQAQRLSVDER